MGGKTEKKELLHLKVYPFALRYEEKYNTEHFQNYLNGSFVYFMLITERRQLYYSRTSMARTLMARLPRLFRTRF